MSHVSHDEMIPTQRHMQSVERKRHPFHFTTAITNYCCCHVRHVHQNPKSIHENTCEAGTEERQEDQGVDREEKVPESVTCGIVSHTV